MLIVSLVTVPRDSFSQQLDREIDSLMNVLKTAAEDTNKVNTLNALNKLYCGTALKAETKGYFDKALQLAQKLNFKRGIANAYFNFGLNYDLQGNYSEALKNQTAPWEIIRKH